MNQRTPSRGPGLFPAVCSFLQAAFPRGRARRIALLAAAGLAASPVAAQTLYVLTDDGKLATAPVAAPGSLSTPQTLTGVTPGETLVGIDVRPQNQRLYALGVNAQTGTVTLYHVSPETSVARPVGPAFSLTSAADGTTPVVLPDPATTDWDIDFNPSADRLRVVAGSLNFRILPNLGQPVDSSTGTGGLNPDGDINGLTSTVGATAYTNNQPNTTRTTQYTLDVATQSLYLQTPPNFGSQTTAVPVSGLTFTAVRGFDIAPGINAVSNNAPVVSGSGFAVLKVGAATSLYEINLVTGAPNLRGNFGVAVRSVAIRTALGAAITLNAGGKTFSRFDPATPGTTSPIGLDVLQPDPVVGIAVRPSTGQFYGLAVNAAANTATLILIDPQNGGMAVVGAQGAVALETAANAAVDLPDPAVEAYGFDFNPVADLIRVVTSTGLNFRIDPNTGLAVDSNTLATGTQPDAALNALPQGSTGLAGAAYTNHFGGATATTLYGVDAASNQLFIQSPPNAGTVTLPLPLTLNGTPLDVQGDVGFDIPPTVSVTTANTAATGDGWLVANVGGSTSIYRVNLATGAATNFGALGGGDATGLVVWAVQPELTVETPVGTVVQNNAPAIDLGIVPVGSPTTRTVKLVNPGGQNLEYTATIPAGAFAVTQNGSGSIPAGGSALVEVTYSPVLGNSAATVTIASNARNVASFTVNFTGLGSRPLGNDAVVSTAGSTRYSPLANDPVSDQVVITSVTDGAIAISGRSLIIPANYVGTFIYYTNDGGVVGQGTVTVTGSTPLTGVTSFTGLVYRSTGAIVGWANVTFNATGICSLQVRSGTDTVKTKVSVAAAVNSTGSVFTKFGFLTLTRNANGNVQLDLAALGGGISGVLRPARSAGTEQKHHIALQSISTTVPGGGYAVATVSKKGEVKIVGITPDGAPFSSATTLADNGSFAFFAMQTVGVKPPSAVGGELFTANLATTDVTGELLWSKLPQLPRTKGLYLGGVSTLLTANGSLYPGTLSFAGAGTLKLRGGNIADETSTVQVTAGIPAINTGAIKSWKAVLPKGGTFTVTTRANATAPLLKGSGLYLPKSKRAWGFFPGTTVGGSIDLTVP